MKGGNDVGLVKEVIEKSWLDIVYGEQENCLKSIQPLRPGLEMTGFFFDYYTPERIQLFGDEGGYLIKHAFQQPFAEVLKNVSTWDTSRCYLPWFGGSGDGKRLLRIADCYFNQPCCYQSFDYLAMQDYRWQNITSVQCVMNVFMGWASWFREIVELVRQGYRVWACRQ